MYLYCIIQSKCTGLPWSWSYGTWIFNYLYNQCLSPLMLWVWILLMLGVLDTTICDKFVSDLRQVCGFLWVLRFPPPIIIDRHDITELLLKVELKTITLTLKMYLRWHKNNIIFISFGHNIFLSKKLGLILRLISNFLCINILIDEHYF